MVRFLMGDYTDPINLFILIMYIEVIYKIPYQYFLIVYRIYEVYLKYNYNSLNWI